MRAGQVADNLPFFTDSLAAISYVDLEHARRTIDPEAPIETSVEVVRTLEQSERGPFWMTHMEDVRDHWRHSLLKSLGALSVVSEKNEALTEKQKRSAGRATKKLGKWTVRDCFDLLEADDIAATANRYKEVLPLLNIFQRGVVRARLIMPSVRKSPHRGEGHHRPNYGSGWATDSFWIEFSRRNEQLRTSEVPEETCPNVLEIKAEAKRIADALFSSSPLSKQQIQNLITSD